jgi:hypothetical protein
MTTHDGFRQQIVCRISVREPRQLAKLARQWWAAIAAELIPLVGRDGFKVLYERSVYLTQARFPWLAPQQADLSFISLNASLAARGSDDAFRASVELLVVFADLLTGLIGEKLTSSIISAAWGDDASNIGAKGGHHE